MCFVTDICVESIDDIAYGFLHFCTLKSIIEASVCNPSWTLESYSQEMGQNTSSKTTKGIHTIEINVEKVSSK